MNSLAIYASERPYQSETREVALGAWERPYRSDVPQRLPEVAPSTQSDFPERRAEVALRHLFGQTYDLSRAFWSFYYARFYFLNLSLSIFCKPLEADYLLSKENHQNLLESSSL